jgi:hypothetical protein
VWGIGRLQSKTVLEESKGSKRFSLTREEYHGISLVRNPSNTGSSWSQEEGSKNAPKDVKFRVEIAVYALEQDRLIWIGTTEMKSSELVEFVQGVVDEIAEEMLKAGLQIQSQ